jgi:hypothetical protein
MMAANSYHHKCEWFPLANLGWVQLDLAGKPTDEPTYSHTLSLAYDVFRNDRRREYVFVYRGTDSYLDAIWSNLAPFVSPAYVFGDTHFDRFLETRQFTKYKIILAGHSLGAGLSLHKSIRGYDAYLFDPSPRIFGPPASEYRPATRVVVFEKGEILTTLRDRTSLWYTAATGGVYQANFDFHVNSKHGVAKAIALHSMFKLAEGIRARGAVVDPRLNLAKLTPRPGPGCDHTRVRRR